MDNGWVSLHRKFEDNWLWKEKRVFSKAEAWIDILFRANHKDAKIVLGNELIMVQRGSFITSEIKLMKYWKWSKSKLRSFLFLLESDGMIKKISDTKKTTLTVVNYNDYQFLKTANKPLTDHKQTAKKLRADTNNNDNNINNDNNTLFAPQEISDSVRILTPENNFYREFKHLKISYEEFEKLKNDFNESDINNVLDRIENHKNNKNYVSLYLTAKNWLTKDLKENKNGKQQSISEATRLIEQAERNKY